MARAKPKDLTQVTISHLKPGPARREVPDGHTRGLFLIVQPSGAMAWAARYRFNGRPRKLTIGAYPNIGLKQARALARAAFVKIAGGADPAAEKRAAKAASPADGRELVENAARLFVERYAKTSQKAATAYETERVLTREIISRWRGRGLGSISRADIHELLDSIVDRGSPIQANRTLSAFRKLCGWSVECGLINASPCTGIRAPAAERSRDRVLADDELKAVWQSCPGLGWPFGGAVQLLILTGQRRSEVAGMKWREIDFDAKVWTLPRERSKNGREHTIPLADPAVAILTGLPRIAGEEGFVFSTNGTAPVSGAGFAAAKKRLDIALPPDMPPWTLHDLRRTFASGCARLRIDLPVVEKCLNHVSGSFRGIGGVYQRARFCRRKTPGDGRVGPLRRKLGDRRAWRQCCAARGAGVRKCPCSIYPKDSFGS